MKGYKALDKDMRELMPLDQDTAEFSGGDIQFEMGKTYSVEGKVIPCCNGFRFCKRIEELNYHYDIAESRIFEVEADGDIQRENMEYCAQSIRLVRELTKQEINDYFKENWQVLIKQNSVDIRRAVAEQGYGLDILIDDEHWAVRQAVAKQGYGLDILINDANKIVRCAVAKQGYGLDVLVYDKEQIVRKTVAEQGYGLELLINDEAWWVRRAVVVQGYGLNVLINDGNPNVRAEVALQGYGLDILVNDEDWWVRKIAKEVTDKNSI